MLSGFMVSVCKGCRCSQSRSYPGLRGGSARWCASSSQAPYRSPPHKCESSFALLLLLFSKKSGDFSGTPLSRTSPGPYPIGRLFSFQGALCERALFANPMGSAKSPLTMFGQRGVALGAFWKKTLQVREIFSAESCYMLL